jgi:hypothetical protein
MARRGKQLPSEKGIHPTMSERKKLSLPMKYEDAVSAFLTVKPEPKKKTKRKSR